MMLCTSSCIGALSLINWLKNYIHEFLDGTKAYIKENVRAVIQTKEIYWSVQVERVG